MIDSKKYPVCESKLTSSDVSCADQLADFATPYTISDLTPLTTYQFRIELVTEFGKSNVYLTDSVQVPFELMPIDEIVTTGTDEQYTLRCVTPLIATERLSFAWYKNEKRLNEMETSAYQIMPPKLSANVINDALIKKINLTNIVNII